MMFVWQMWSSRNLWVFEKKRNNARLLCERTLRFYRRLARDGWMDGWQTPRTNRWKVNVDTTVKEGKMGLVMVVRSRMGDVNMAAGGYV